jgi:hypothetical protein
MSCEIVKVNNLSQARHSLIASPHCFLSLIATMLDVPELDQMVCQHLSRHDLAQCARVSKQWWSIVAPHIWGDLSWLSAHDAPHQRTSFYKMVLADFLNKQQQQEEQPSPCPCSPILPQYGHYIRILPDPVKNYEMIRLVPAGQAVPEGSEISSISSTVVRQTFVWVACQFISRTWSLIHTIHGEQPLTSLFLVYGTCSFQVIFTPVNWKHQP